MGGREHRNCPQPWALQTCTTPLLSSAAKAQSALMRKTPGRAGDIYPPPLLASQLCWLRTPICALLQGSVFFLD